MWGAYIFQIVNLAAAVFITTLLLRYLGQDEYALWLLFSATCLATVQIQNGVQGVAIKEIAIAYHKSEEYAFHQAIRRALPGYRRLAMMVVGPVTVGSLVYFHFVMNISLLEMAAWCALAASYAVNYWFGSNNAILLATDKVSLSNNINTFTRIVSLICTVGLVLYRPSLLGPCVAVLISSILAVIIIRRYARRQVARFTPLAQGQAEPVRAGLVVRYTLYTFAAFALYSGALIVVAPLFPQDIASYGLALQMSALIATMSMVPLQVWLARLLRSDHLGARRELRMAALVCNFLFIGAYAALILIAPTLLRLIGAEVTLPQPEILMLMGTAFIIELNIAIAVNHLTAHADYSFTTRYVLVAATALATGTAVAVVTGILWLGFLLVPAIIQGLVSAPYFVRKVNAVSRADEPDTRLADASSGTEA